MRKITSGILSCAIVSLSQIASASSVQGGDDVEAIARFIKENLIGRRLYQKTVVAIDEGRVEAHFEREQQYNGFKTTPEGFSFDAVASIKQQNFDVDKNAKTKSQKPVIRNRVVVSRYEFRQAKSTGKLIGVRRFTTSTLNDPTANVQAIRKVSLCNNGILFDLTSVNYGDCTAQDQNFKPCAFDTTEEFTVDENKKLHLATTNRKYYVDPDTMERERVVDESGAVLPEKVLHDIEQ